MIMPSLVSKIFFEQRVHDRLWEGEGSNAVRWFEDAQTLHEWRYPTTAPSLWTAVPQAEVPRKGPSAIFDALAEGGIVMLVRAILLLAVVLFAGCEIFDRDDERDIDLNDVPQAAMAAAQAAVQGIEFTSAETEVEKGVTVYSLEGVAGAQEYEVEVTAEGKVLEVETD